MNIFGQTISVLFALTLLGALGIGGYFAIDYIIALFSSMDTQVARVTAVASVVVLLAATLIASTIRQSGKQSRANPLHADKVSTYRLFVDTWTNLLHEGQGTIALSEALQALDQPLALHGSPAVIHAHNALRAWVAENGTQDPEAKTRFAKALLEVRKDIGSDTNGLTAEALSRLVLPDPGQPGVIVAGLVPDPR